MSKNTDRVLAGFTALSNDERAEAIRLLNDFIEADATRKRVLKESYGVKAGLDLGPTNQGGCPCCGK